MTARSFPPGENLVVVEDHRESASRRPEIGRGQLTPERGAQAALVANSIYPSTSPGGRKREVKIWSRRAKSAVLVIYHST